MPFIAPEKPVKSGGFVAPEKPISGSVQALNRTPEKVSALQGLEYKAAAALPGVIQGVSDYGVSPIAQMANALSGAVSWAEHRVQDVANVPTDIKNRLAMRRYLGRWPTQADMDEVANNPSLGPADFVPYLSETSPRPKLPRVTNEDVDLVGKQLGIGEKIYAPIAGAANVASTLVEGFVPPFAPPGVGLATPLLGAGKNVGRTAGIAFGGPLLATLPEQVDAAHSTITDPNATLLEKTEATLTPVASTAMGGMMLGHAARTEPSIKVKFPDKRPPLSPEEPWTIDPAQMLDEFGVIGPQKTHTGGPGRVLGEEVVPKPIIDPTKGTPSVSPIVAATTTTPGEVVRPGGGPADRGRISFASEAGGIPNARQQAQQVPTVEQVPTKLIDTEGKPLKTQGKGERRVYGEEKVKRENKPLEMIPGGKPEAPATHSAPAIAKSPSDPSGTTLAQRLANLPSVQSGMVRLFHGGDSSVAGMDFTPSASYADGYRYMKNGNGGSVWWIDVPQDAPFLKWDLGVKFDAAGNSIPVLINGQKLPESVSAKARKIESVGQRSSKGSRATRGPQSLADAASESGTNPVEQWADATINEGRKRSYTGLDPELMAAYAVKGAFMIGRGARDFAQWSAAMLKEYGTAIKPHLEALFKQAQSILNGTHPDKGLSARVLKFRADEMTPGEKTQADVLVPALRTAEGKQFIGEKGQTHNDIYAAQGDVEGRLLKLEGPEHGFVDVKGKFLSRQEAADRLGETEPLQSERLRELQQGGEKSVGQQPNVESLRQRYPKANEESLSLAADLGLDKSDSVPLSIGLRKIADDELSHGVTKHERLLAQFLLDNFPDAVEDTTIHKNVSYSAFDRPAFYYNTRVIDLALDRPYAADSSVVLHEAGHAATHWAMRHPKTEAQRMAVKRLAAILKEAQQKLPVEEFDLVRRFSEEEDATAIAKSASSEAAVHRAYGMQSLDEMVAGVFNSQHVRDFLNSIDMKGQSLLKRIVDAFKTVLGIKKGTALDQVFENLVELGQGPTKKANLLRGDKYEKGTFDSLSGEGDKALGMTPKGRDEFFIDRYGWLSDVPSNEALMKEMENKIGWERLSVGKLLGTRARITTGQDKAVGGWYFTKHGFGPAQASAMGQRVYDKVNPVFPRIKDKARVKAFVDSYFDPKSINMSKEDFVRILTKEGALLDVKPKGGGKVSLFASDVFEALRRDPNAFELTKEQRAALDDTMKPILERMAELTEKYDVAEVRDESGDLRPYFMRVAKWLPETLRDEPNGWLETAIEKVRKRIQPGPKERKSETAGGGIGFNAKQFMQKQRAFKTEAEGWAYGVKYVTDLEARMQFGVERLYRAIADKQLLKHPELKHRSRARVEKEARMYYANELKSGEMSEAGLKRYVDSIQREGTIKADGFFGKIYDRKTARLLNREFAAESSSLRKKFVLVNNTLKGLKLGYDFGVWSIQLALTATSHPILFTKSIPITLKNMAVPEVFAEFVRQKWDTVKWLADAGSPIGRMEEYRQGLGKGQPLTNIPYGIGKITLAAGRAFQTPLDYTKIMLAEAYRHVTPKDEVISTVRAIENTLLSSRMESNMVTHRRSLLERVFFLAPAYYRGAIELVGLLGEKGVKGAVARRALISYSAAILAGYYAVGKALGMSDEELRKRYNPMKPDFLLWRIEHDGRELNFGLGGIYRSVVRLIGQMYATSVEHPGNWKSLSPDKNPLTRFYRSHSAPVPSIAMDQFTGADFLGREANLETVGTAAVPLALSAETPKQMGMDTVGLTTYYRNKNIEDYAREQGKKVSELSLGERAKATGTLKEGRKEEEGDTVRAAKYSIDKQEDNKRVVLKGIKPSNRKYVEEQGLKFGPVSYAFNVHGTTIRLTEDEQSFLEAETIKRYDEYIERFRSKGKKSQERLDTMLSLARERARNELRKKMIADAKAGVR